MDEFERLFLQERVSVERFVKFKIIERDAAEDILQDVYMTAMQKFGSLKNKDAFKAWIISIARNKCNDYFRKKARMIELPPEDFLEEKMCMSRYGITETTTVRETVRQLGNNDKQILYLYFWKEMILEQISELLKIPLGTVKSRLYKAKQNFKKRW